MPDAPACACPPSTGIDLNPSEPVLLSLDESALAPSFTAIRNANPPLRYPVAGLQHWLDLNA